MTKESFIEKVEDASGEVVTTLNSEINTNNIGTYKIEIKAIDKNGNEVVKTANLIVKKMMLDLQFQDYMIYTQTNIRE